MSGGGAGAGLGGILGTAAGAALAPETGGLSLAIPALAGAAGGSLGGGVGSAITGGGNPWSSALTGGLGGAASGLAGGFLSGLLSPTADAAGAAADAAPATADAGTTGTSALGDTGALTSASASNDAAFLAPQGAAGSSPLDTSVIPSSGGIGSSGIAAPSAPPAAPDSPNWLQRNVLPSWAGGTSSPVTPPNAVSGAGGGAKAASSGLSDYLLPAGLGLGALNALGLFGTQGSNPVNSAPINSATANMNTPLPSYNYNSTQTPYTGNWYTYGQRPETPMISNQLTPAAQGGLIKGYASGGMIRPIPIPKLAVRRLAIGGMPMQAPPQGALPSSPMGAMPPPMPPQGMLPRPASMPPAAGAPMASPQQKPNPLQHAAQFQIGQKIGQALRHHIKNQGMTPDGIVNGIGKGQDDVVPAKLSNQEYVVPADVVGQLGDGSSNAGGKALDQMVHHVRAHKVSHGAKFPPKAKSPLAYIGKA